MNSAILFKLAILPCNFIFTYLLFTGTSYKLLFDRLIKIFITYIADPYSPDMATGDLFLFP